ncbi:MAG: sigma-70 family RNA polymerase sigma factor [Paludibacteraceae bacterium]|nr:sigma-70 family RNA polymerase sigma factor [Paludibacteraceae bacterium]
MQIDNNFINQHDRLVRVIVNQFKVANVDPEDLMQEGRIGLIEAAKRFDPNMGVQFASYASWWIRREVKNAIQAYGNVVRMPDHCREAYTSVSESINTQVYAEEKEALTYADLLTSGECIEDVIIRREEAAELHARLKKMIGHLPTIDQQVICALYGFEEDSVEETELATRLHKSPKWIHRVHLRALKQLRSLMDEDKR